MDILEFSDLIRPIIKATWMSGIVAIDVYSVQNPNYLLQNRFNTIIVPVTRGGPRCQNSGMQCSI